jgi:hypothetical protein
MTDTKLTAATFLGAAAFLALTGIHVTHGTFDDQLTSFADYANDTSFTIALIGSAAAAQLLRRAGAGRKAVLAATFGPLLVAVGVVAGLILGHSPSWFAAAGVPGNLVWLAGLVALAVWHHRARVLPAWGYALPLIMVFGVIVAEIGGSVVAALLLGALAARLGRAPALGRPAVGRVA